MNKFIKIFIIILMFLPIKVFAASQIDTNIDNLLNNIISLKSSIFLDEHPVGSIYITTSESENTIAKMASVHGGTWEVYAPGKVIVGYNSSVTEFNTINKTGGSKTTTLATANLPSHTHTISHTHTTPATTISSSGAHTHSTTAKTITTGISLTAQSAGAHTHSFQKGGTALVINSSSNPGGTSGFKAGTNSGWYHELPKVIGSIDPAGAHTHSVTGSITIPALSIASSGAHTHTAAAMTTNSQSTTTSGATGSGTAFSNLQPYITVYMYKRVK